MSLQLDSLNNPSPSPTVDDAPPHATASAARYAVLAGTATTTSDTKQHEEDIDSSLLPGSVNPSSSSGVNKSGGTSQPLGASSPPRSPSASSSGSSEATSAGAGLHVPDEGEGEGREGGGGGQQRRFSFPMSTVEARASQAALPGVETYELEPEELQAATTSARVRQLRDMHNIHGGSALNVVDTDPELRKMVREPDVIDPRSTYLEAWHLFVVLLSIWQAFSVPFRAVFGFDDPWAWFAADLVCDVCFLVDIYVSFHTGYLLEGGIVQDKQLIAERYLRGYFLVDVLASLPLDLIQLALGRWELTCRLNKLFRMRFAVSYVHRAEEHPEYNVTLVIVTKLVFVTILFSHFLACGWFAFGVLFGFGDTPWAPSEELMARPRYSQYIQSLYVALGTMAGVGTRPDPDADLPETHLESMYAMLMIMVGVLLFSYIVGSIEQAVEQANENYQHFQTNVNRTMRFMENHHVKHELRVKVWNFYSYSWDRKFGFDSSNPSMKSLRIIPEALRSDMAYYLPRSVLFESNFFEHLERGFLEMCVAMLTAVIITPGEYVTRAGDVGNKIYFIYIGEVKILVGMNKTCVATLYPGDSLGEYSVIFDQKRSAYAQAVTFCDLYALSKANLTRAMEVYPRSARELVRRVKNNRKSTKTKERRLNLHKSKKKKGRQRASRMQMLSFDRRRSGVFVQYGDEDGEFTIAPDSRMFARWQYVRLLVTLYNIWVIPFRAAFLFYNGAEDHPAFIVLDVIADIALLLDIVVNFFTAYIEDGYVISERHLIRSRYLRSWFLVDLISALPIDLLAAAAGAPRNPLLRFGRFLRLYQFFLILDKLLAQSTHYRKLTLARLLFVILLLSHWLSCLYSIFTFVEGYDGVTNRWLPHTDLEDANSMLRYWRAQFYSMSMLTRAGRSIPPETDAEILFSLIGLFLGLFVVAYLIGNVAAIISNLDTFRSTFKREKRFAVDYLSYRNFPGDIRERVRAVYDQNWNSQKGADPNLVLSHLPRGLKSEILMDLCGSVLQQVPLFADAPLEFIQALAWKLRFEVFPLGEYIFREGQVGAKMYFIFSGQVSLLLPVNISGDAGSHRRRPARPVRKTLEQLEDESDVQVRVSPQAKKTDRDSGNSSFRTKTRRVLGVTTDMQHEMVPINEEELSDDSEASPANAQRPEQQGGRRQSLSGRSGGMQMMITVAGDDGTPEGPPTPVSVESPGTPGPNDKKKDKKKQKKKKQSFLLAPSPEDGDSSEEEEPQEDEAKDAGEDDVLAEHLIDGIVHLDKDALEFEESFRVIGTGSFFGEGAIFTGVRSASAQALSACSLFSLQLEDFENVFAPHPNLRASLLALSQKREAATRKLAAELREPQVRSKRNSLRRTSLDTTHMFDARGRPRRRSLAPSPVRFN